VNFAWFQKLNRVAFTFSGFAQNEVAD